MGMRSIRTVLDEATGALRSFLLACLMLREPNVELNQSPRVCSAGEAIRSIQCAAFDAKLGFGDHMAFQARQLERKSTMLPAWTIRTADDLRSRDSCFGNPELPPLPSPAPLDAVQFQRLRHYRLNFFDFFDG